MTNATTNLLKNIQAALAASPELATQMNACTSKTDLAAVLSKTLPAAVSVADLTALEQQHKADMSDAQLDAVAGGIDDKALLVSLVGLGFGCLFVSAVADIKEKGSCDKHFAR